MELTAYLSFECLHLFSEVIPDQESNIGFNMPFFAAVGPF
jgi:hypothetical protein